jgi:hypothetical protein
LMGELLSMAQFGLWRFLSQGWMNMRGLWKKVRPAVAIEDGGRQRLRIGMLLWVEALVLLLSHDLIEQLLGRHSGLVLKLPRHLLTYF